MTPREDAKFALEETRALLALDRLKEAAQAASHALAKIQALEPGDQGRAYVLVGDVFAQNGDRGRAIELLELAVGLLQGSGRPYLVEGGREARRRARGRRQAGRGARGPAARGLRGPVHRPRLGTTRER